MFILKIQQPPTSLNPDNFWNYDNDETEPDNRNVI
jgi:hypothetical protein